MKIKKIGCFTVCYPCPLRSTDSLSLHIPTTIHRVPVPIQPVFVSDERDTPDGSSFIRNLMPLDRLSQNTDTDYVDYFIRRKRGIVCDRRHN